MENNVNISSPDDTESANSAQQSQEATFDALSIDEEECFVKQGQGGDIISFDQEYSRSCLVEMIVMHEYPLSIVNHIGLKSFASIIQPLFKIPSQNEIIKDILRLYEEEKLKLTEALDENESRVAITTDMWTSNQSKGYMVVTAYYIDSSWNLQSRVLSCTYVPTPHTSEVLAHTLMKILMEWNLDRKLSTVTLDNCSTNDAMKYELLARLDGRYLLLRGKFLHMHCGAHMLNLIVKDGLEIIKESVEKIRNSVLYWSATPKRHEKFVTWCNKSGVPFTKKLVVDCPTKWISTYVMLETAWLYKDVFPCLRQKEPQYTSVLSSEEWKLAKDICDRLKVFYDATQLFSRTQHPTANLYFLKICKMKLALDEWITSPNPSISHVAHNMMTKFQKYWDDVLDIMSVAAVLDPRYKMCLIEFYFSKLYPIDYSKHVERIQQICYDLINVYQRKKSSLSSSGHELSAQQLIDSGDPYDLYVREKKKAKISSVKTELDYYLDEDVLPRYRDFDILVWWKMDGVKYPTLQQIARDLLAIPVSTFARESASSASGCMIGPNRGKLKEDLIEALVCARNWLLASKNEDGNHLTLNDFPTVNDGEEEW